jgi:hypothetical protein
MTESSRGPTPKAPLSRVADLAPSAREQVVAHLTESFAHDLLTLDEFEYRVAAAYSATTAADLAALTADLARTPAPAFPDAASQATAAPKRLSVVFGNMERGGVVDVPATFELRAFAGNMELDLRDAHFAPGVTEITIRSFMGNVELMLPPDVQVENYGGSVLGSFEYHGSSRGALMGRASRVVRLKGRVIMSSVVVRN